MPEQRTGTRIAARRVEYLCEKCGIAVRLCYDQRPGEKGIPHKCPVCDRDYYLNSAYPRLEEVVEKYGGR